MHFPRIFLTLHKYYSSKDRSLNTQKQLFNLINSIYALGNTLNLMIAGFVFVCSQFRAQPGGRAIELHSDRELPAIAGTGQVCQGEHHSLTSSLIIINTFLLFSFCSVKLFLSGI